MIHVVIPAGLCALGALVLVIWFVKRAVHVMPPAAALVVTGPFVAGPRGRRGPVIVRGGRYLQKPLIELVDTLDLRPLEVKVPVPGDQGGLSGQLTAVVKIAGQQPLIDRAARLLLGVSRAEISRITGQVLQFHATAILLRRSPEEVLADPRAFEQQLLEEVDDELNGLGLLIDTVTVDLRR
jgi:uncharacterized membrane protein YqiK